MPAATRGVPASQRGKAENADRVATRDAILGVREVWPIEPRAAPGETRLRVLVSGGIGIASL